VSARTRIGLLVGLVAVAAAALVVGITAATSSGPSGSVAAPQARTGAPPLSLDLAVVTDAEVE